MIQNDFTNREAARAWKRDHKGSNTLTPGQMAARLGVTPEKVEAYLKSIGHKWGPKSEPYFPPEVFADAKRRFAR